MRALSTMLPWVGATELPLLGAATAFSFPLQPIPGDAAAAVFREGAARRAAR